MYILQPCNQLLAGCWPPYSGLWLFFFLPFSIMPQPEMKLGPNSVYPGFGVAFWYAADTCCLHVEDRPYHVAHVLWRAKQLTHSTIRFLRTGSKNIHCWWPSILWTLQGKWHSGALIKILLTAASAVVIQTTFSCSGGRIRDESYRATQVGCCLFWLIIKIGILMSISLIYCKIFWSFRVGQ